MTKEPPTKQTKQIRARRIQHSCVLKSDRTSQHETKNGKHVSLQNEQH